jgi:EAL domain-containing protein (putative c-di-GMP-specific phosphodiesterase class I)
MADPRLQFRAGEAIFREGDAPGCAYLIDEGRVEVSTQQSGKKLVFSYLGPGDLLGEMAVIDDAVRTADALAITDCRLIEIRRDQIQERLSEADSIIRILVHALLQRYRTGLSAVRGKSRAPTLADVQRSDGSEAPGGLTKFRLESQLISALEREELTLVYQPIFDIQQNRVIGFEALARWDHPERGPISPAEFIALAEETSLILPVGQYALEKSCAALTALGPDHDHISVAVNISARQSAAPDFADMLVRTAQAHGLPPSRVELEITESLTLDYRAVAALIDRCHELGISVSLDDFGTGYSSLGHLHQLRFDVVKLDQAFTRQMLTDPRCLELVRGIVRMILAIGAEALAEGVETLEQARALKSMGVRYLQGWLIGRPSPAEQMPEMLKLTFAG